MPAPPEPTRVFFDPFNSSSTGHQRAENRLSGSTSWRESRSHKLKNQFKDTTGGGGTKHLSDLVGAGSENFGKDGRKDNGGWEIGAPGLRGSGWQDIRGLLGNPKKRRCDSIEDVIEKKRRFSAEAGNAPEEDVTLSLGAETTALSNTPLDDEEPVSEQPPQIFRGLTIYLNGSTMPLVSDLKLKQLFAQHGGNTSIALGRRTVTHVILGERCGGGLASGKIQKENTTVRGKGIKYVSAQWVLDSVEKGIRQSEHKYAAAEIRGKLGGSGQKSVAGLFRAKSA